MKIKRIQTCHKKIIYLNPSQDLHVTLYVLKQQNDHLMDDTR